MKKMSVKNLYCQKQVLKSTESAFKITEIVVGFSSLGIFYFGDGEYLYSPTSVIKRFCSRPNQFSAKKLEIFMFHTSNIIRIMTKSSECKQTDCLPPSLLL